MYVKAKECICESKGKAVLIRQQCFNGIMPKGIIRIYQNNFESVLIKVILSQYVSLLGE